MTDVFISYARADRPLIERIATALRELGLEVWYDINLEPGDSFPSAINDKGRAAKIMLVCWSPSAVQSNWVTAEAHFALERDKLVTCQVAGQGKLDLPMPFNIRQVEDLRSWLASPSEPSAEWRRLIRHLFRRCGLSEPVPYRPNRTGVIEHKGSMGPKTLKLEREAGIEWDFSELFDYGSGTAGVWVTCFRIAGHNRSGQQLDDVIAQVIPQHSPQPVFLQFQIGPGERVDTADHYIEPDAEFVLSAPVPSPPHAHGSHGYTPSEFLQNIGGFGFVFQADGIKFQREFEYDHVERLVLAAEQELGPKPPTPTVRKRT